MLFRSSLSYSAALTIAVKAVVEVAEELRKADRYRFPFGYGGVSGAPGKLKEAISSFRRGEAIGFPFASDLVSLTSVTEIAACA